MPTMNDLFISSIVPYCSHES